MDFTQVTNILNSGSTGIVSLVLALENFISTRKGSEKQATVDEYIEWLHEQNNQEILDSQRDILAAIERSEETSLLKSYVEKMLHHVEYHASTLNGEIKGSGLPLTFKRGLIQKEM